ncbi:heavy-metal-associated domain-containing protein [Geobacter sp.]|uniref:heavy-metal-associated domain-containing protein n=1 Tax=Geobacter sp. TaxID=46610 RepID=UPI0026190676|nr:heavy-metal-associated domain-containing protein [Geobacter sp.]
MVVASHFDGRIRIRDEGLKKEPLLARVREALLATPGVSAVEGNPRVGSLLVLYSAALTAVEKILETIADLIGSGETGEKTAESGKVLARVPFSIPAKVKRKATNFGMLAALLLSVAAAIFDLKKLHILAGIVFLALFGVHFFERKEYLFA